MIRGVVLAVSLVLAGCQTSGNLFSNPGNAVEKALLEDDFQSASYTIADNRDWFHANVDAVDKFVAASLSKFDAGAQAAISALDPAKLDTQDKALWKEAREARHKADDLLDEMEPVHDALRKLEREFTPYSELEASTKAFDVAAKRNASTAFVGAIDREWAGSFFDHYPAVVSAKEEWRKHGAKYLETFGKDNRRLLIIESVFGQSFSDKDKEEFGLHIFENALASRVEEGRSPSIQQILEANKEASDLGYRVKESGLVKAHLVELTSKTLQNALALEFPIEIVPDLPVSAERKSLESALEPQTFDGNDIVILLDVSAARVDRAIASRKNIGSEFKSGERQEPNPAYGQAQASVQAAQSNLQSAQFNQISTDNQYCYGIGCLGKAIAQIAAAAATSKAQGELENALNVMSQTPTMLVKPVYSPYSFVKSEIDVVKEAVVHYTVLDKTNGWSVTDTFDAVEKQSFTVPYQMHNADRYKAKHLKGTDSEEDVLDFEGRPVKVELSAILNAVADMPREDIPSIEEVRQQIAARHTRQTELLRASTYTAGAPENDVRMDSVVVVYNPNGGLGSGFYVAADLVLTNFHVVEGSSFVEFKLYSGQETFGKVIATDPRRDLALVKAQARGTAVKFFEGNRLSLGREVVALGHPENLEFSLTRGVISAVRELDTVIGAGGKPVLFVQTDAAINPGNSGGPLFMGDHVIAINTQKLAKTEIEGLAFSVHHSEIADFLKSNLPGS